MPSINFEQFYAELQDVLKNPRPWAHIRYGDGEGIVMGYPEHTSSNKAAGRWRKWLGHDKIDMKLYAALIRASVGACDIVGTPCLRHDKINQDWRNVKKYLGEYGLTNADTKACCMDCTIELQRKGLYRGLLNGRESIYYISCRDVDEDLKAKCGIKNIYKKLIPPQHRPCLGVNHSGGKHYPDMYGEIVDWIRGVANGNLFLVGAGGLGKIYCMEIKRSGGIALDIGSIFDGWAGLKTRSYLTGMFRL